MRKKAAACLLVCASVATWVSCGSTSSRFLYAAVPAANEVVIFREDPNAGVLTQLAGSPITAGQAVQSLALHPSKKFLYAANSGVTPVGNISLYTISASGALTEVTPRTNAGSSPTLLAMDAAGTFLCAANSGSGDISVYSIDASSGALTQIGTNVPIGMSALNMVISPSGNILYVTGQPGNTGAIQAFSINLSATAPAAPLSALPTSPYLTGNDPAGLVIAPGGGFLYTANKIDGTISEFTVNSDGSLTALAGSPIGVPYKQPIALLVEKSGKYIYVANQGSSNLAAFSIGSNGGLNLLANSQFGTAGGPTIISADPSGKYLFVGSQSGSSIQSMSLDESSGVLTSVGTYSVGTGTPTSIVVTP
jgi:6-phosphogluconolactonase